MSHSNRRTPIWLTPVMSERFERRGDQVGGLLDNLYRFSAMVVTLAIGPAFGYLMDHAG